MDLGLSRSFLKIMISFQHLLHIDVKATTDVEILAKETTIPTKNHKSQMDWRASQIAKGKEYFSSGRPGGYQWECRFCRLILKSRGHVLDHWKKKHFLKTKHTKTRQENGSWSCKVCGPLEGVVNSRFNLMKHLKNRTSHTMPELLDAGYNAWLWYEHDLPKLKEIHSYLVQKKYIQVVPKKKPIKSLKNQAKKKTLQKKEWLPLNLKNQSFSFLSTLSWV